MKEIFLRIWDTNDGGFKVRSFDATKIVNVSYPPEDVPLSLNPMGIKSVFDYEGQKHLCSDEKAFIQTRMNE